MKRILLPVLVIGVLLLGACGAPSTPLDETPLTPATYTLSVSVSPSGAGSVSPSGGQYQEGTQVPLTATAASGYTFDYWGGSVSGSADTITITMDSDKSVTAYFKLIPEPEPTPIKLLQLSGPPPLEHPIWDRGIGSLSIGGETVAENTFLFIMGSATNIGTETLESVICVMKCWRGDTLVKTEEYVIGTVFEEADIIIYDKIEPGASFEFDIQTSDDPTVDNVTIEFKDSSGNIIPHVTK